MTAERFRRPKIGIILPISEGQMDGHTPRWSDILEMARRVEDLGFDSLWLVDHLHVRFPHRDASVWECWSLLSALAACTERVEIGTLVLCSSFRNPALLAKMAVTVDDISNGRLMLGLGAGHHEPEYRMFGFPFDRRVARFTEAIQIIHSLLKTGHVDFDGEYYRARDCEIRPRGPRPDGPPIMIGTTGPRMLRLTAAYADSWNVYFDKSGNQVDSVARFNRDLDAACAEIGRDPNAIERTASVLVGTQGQSRIQGIAAPPVSDSLDDIAAELRAYAQTGFSHIQIRVEPNTIESLETFAPVLDSISQS